MENPCCQCEGTGKVMCPACVGTGKLYQSSLIDEACPKCKETGQTLCPECGGSGVSPFTTTDSPPQHIAISGSR